MPETTGTTRTLSPWTAVFAAVALTLAVIGGLDYLKAHLRVSWVNPAPAPAPAPTPKPDPKPAPKPFPSSLEGFPTSWMLGGGANHA